MKIIPAIMMKLQKIKFGTKCRFYGFPIITKSKKAELVLGDRCRIRSGFFTNLIGLYQRTVIVAKDTGKVRIGNDVGMSGVTIYARSSIQIGDKCLIGANTKIIDNDFHPVDPEVRRATPGKGMSSAPIEIGENVFIGCNSLVLKGVTIGDNSVIGAGSVVVKSIPANCLAAGNPAKVLRTFEITEDKDD